MSGYLNVDNRAHLCMSNLLFMEERGQTIGEQQVEAVVQRWRIAHLAGDEEMLRAAVRRELFIRSIIGGDQR